MKQGYTDEGFMSVHVHKHSVSTCDSTGLIFGKECRPRTENACMRLLLHILPVRFIWTFISLRSCLCFFILYQPIYFREWASNSAKTCLKLPHVTWREYLKVTSYFPAQEDGSSWKVEENSRDNMFHLHICVSLSIIISPSLSRLQIKQRLFVLLSVQRCTFSTY